ncbi:FecR domain-containing protein [Sphingobacterium ginsenosidimutans]
MNRKNKFSTILLKKYLDGQCTDVEKELVERWYKEMNAGPVSLDTVQINENLNIIRNRLAEHIHSDVPVVWYRRRYSMVASIILALSLLAGLIYFQSGGSARKPKPTLDKEKAFMITAEGDTVNLMEIAASQGEQLNGILIEKDDKGQIYYSTLDNVAPRNIKIVTPAAGQYQFVLPDGSKVHLNANSSLVFNSHFSQGARTVQLNGEAYFEVNKQVNNRGQKNPFIVTSKGQIITVLGTHFNVCAYDDEAYSRTTLIEGSIELRALLGQQASLILKPGQKVTLNNIQGTIAPEGIRKETAVDWTAGYYKFENEKLPLLLTRISRWYDVDIVLDPSLTELTFGGRISRKDDLTKAIEILEMTDEISVQLQEQKPRNKLIIKPKTEK